MAFSPRILEHSPQVAHSNHEAVGKATRSPDTLLAADGHGHFQAGDVPRFWPVHRHRCPHDDLICDLRGCGRSAVTTEEERSKVELQALALGMHLVTHSLRLLPSDHELPPLR